MHARPSARPELARAISQVTVTPVTYRDLPAREYAALLCTPPGQEEFFALIGDPVATRTSPRPEIGDDEQAERMSKALAIAPQYRTELLLP